MYPYVTCVYSYVPICIRVLLVCYPASVSMWSLSQDLKQALLSIFPAISFNKRYGIKSAVKII